MTEPKSFNMIVAPISRLFRTEIASALLSAALGHRDPTRGRSICDGHLSMHNRQNGSRMPNVILSDTQIYERERQTNQRLNQKDFQMVHWCYWRNVTWQDQQLLLLSPSCTIDRSRYVSRRHWRRKQWFIPSLTCNIIYFIPYGHSQPSVSIW